MRSVIAMILIGYLIGVGITLANHRVDAGHLSRGKHCREMPYALAWPASLVRDASIADDTPAPGPRPPEG